MKTRIFQAWGIYLGKTSFDREHGHPGHGLAGKYLFKKGEPPPWHGGIPTVVFCTRAEAQDALKATTIKQTWKRAKVVKVNVEITVVQEETMPKMDDVPPGSDARKLMEALFDIFANALEGAGGMTKAEVRQAGIDLWENDFLRWTTNGEAEVVAAEWFNGREWLPVKVPTKGGGLP